MQNLSFYTNTLFTDFNKDYQSYLYNKDYFFKNKLFAPLQTRIIFPLFIPIHFENPNSPKVKNRNKYYIFQMSVLDNLSAPISSEYKDKILSLLMPEEQ